MDIAIIVILAVAAIGGWRKGIVRQAGSLVALFVALLLSRSLAPEEPGLAAQIIPEAIRGTLLGSYAALTITRVVIFAVAYACVMLLARVMRMAVRAAMLGPVDRILGALLGVAKWGLALSLVFNLWLCLRKPLPDGAPNLPGGKVVETVTAFAPALWGEAPELYKLFSTTNDDSSTTNTDDGKQ